MTSGVGLLRSDARTVTSGRDDLADLVVQARTGDSEAFRAIFQRFGKPVLGFLYNLLGERTAAEECVQETFVRAYRRLGSIRDARVLETWLFGIARNVAREAIKQKYREQRKVGLEESPSLGLEDGAPQADERLIGAELGRAIRRALGALKQDQREVFTLKLLERKSYQEIARITGSSVGKLKTDLHRARLEMKRRLRSYVGQAATEVRE